jgi:hypothetical protein
MMVRQPNYSANDPKIELIFCVKGCLNYTNNQMRVLKFLEPTLARALPENYQLDWL